MSIMADFRPPAAGLQARETVPVKTCIYMPVLQVPLPAAEPVWSKCCPPDATSRVFLSAGNPAAEHGRPKRCPTGSEQVFMGVGCFPDADATAARETKNVQMITLSVPRSRETVAVRKQRVFMRQNPNKLSRARCLWALRATLWEGLNVLPRTCQEMQYIPR